MAEFNINIEGDIRAIVTDDSKAVIVNKNMNSGDAIILDPVTESFSNLGTLNFYELTIIDYGTTTAANILNNGKNSRFTAEGAGIVIVQLEVKDNQENSDTANIQITIS